jgi:hypothetical protein
MQILFLEIRLDYFVGILWSNVIGGAVYIYRGFHIRILEKGGTNACRILSVHPPATLEDE